MEDFQVFQFFARACELDRFSGHGTNRQCRTAASVAVQLGQDHTVDRQRFVKRLRNVDGILTGHCVNHQQDLLRRNGFTDVLQFRHQLFVNMQTTGRVENYVIVAVVFCVCHGRFGNLHRVDGTPLKHRHTGALAHHLQLRDSGRSVHVTSNQ